MTITSKACHVRVQQDPRKGLLIRGLNVWARRRRGHCAVVIAALKPIIRFGYQLGGEHGNHIVTVMSATLPLDVPGSLPWPRRFVRVYDPVGFARRR
jgi:hypothetical protein